MHDKLGLELNSEKTNISNTKQGFSFLGAQITKNESIVIKASYTNKTATISKRASRRMTVNAPLTSIIEKMIANKFLRRNAQNVVLARGRKDLINHTHYQIIQFFNARIRGILNFYSFAANYSSLSRIVWLFTQSCALTLALKHKMFSMKKAFGKFGRYLEDRETGVQLYHEKSMMVKHDYKNSKDTPSSLDKILAGSPHGTLTTRFQQTPCVICGSTTQVEMHHLRKASDIREKIRKGKSTYQQ